MGDLLISLIPTALAGALAPVLVLPVIFMLGTKRAIPNTLAFAVAALILYVAIGAIGIFFVGGQLSVSESDTSKISAIVSLVLGVIALLVAALQWRSAPGNEKWMTRQMQSIESIAPGKAFGLGLMMPLFGAKNLMVYMVCLNLIGTARLSAADSISAMSVVLLIFAPQVIIPIVIYAMVAERAAVFLASIQNWVIQHNRAIGIGASLLVGIMMLSKGLADLAIFK